MTDPQNDTLKSLEPIKRPPIRVRLRSYHEKLEVVDLSRMTLGELHQTHAMLQNQYSELIAKVDAMKEEGLPDHDQRLFKTLRAKRAVLAALEQVKSVIAAVKQYRKDKNIREVEEKKAAAEKRKRDRLAQAGNLEVPKEDRRYFHFLKAFRYVAKQWYSEHAIQQIDDEANRIVEQQLEEAEKRKRYG
jgi:vacuolar-type H+-ATPase subunit I/STV1